MENKNEKKIKEDIFRKIKELYKLSWRNKKFVPGESYINYGGKIYDEQELINLVDSSLEFWLTAGRYAEEFEKKLAGYLGLKFCLLANSGSSANLLAISALTSPKLDKRRLKPGDEVITTACGFPTTLNPILQNNLVPVFIDVKLGTYNIDAGKIEKAISKKTKAIFIAHSLGNPADIGKILKIAKKYNLWLVEDNCDSLGSKYKGKYTGTFGDISTCSFYPAHHITMGEGGAVLTDNFELKKIIASFRDWGRDCWCEPGCDNTCKNRFSWKLGKLPLGYDHKYVYSHVGYNLKITDLQAAIGVAQLKKLPSFIKARQKNFASVYRFLSGYGNFFILPEINKNSAPSWFGFPILIKEKAPFSRADIVNYLEENKIATRTLFGGNLLKHPAYENIKCRVSGPLENTDFIMDNFFFIGVHPLIGTEQLKYIEKIFNNFLKNYGTAY